jgi:imidazolonepropionase
MILIHGARQLVTPTTGGFQILEDAAIAAEGGTIQFVGSTKEAMVSFPDAEKVDAGGKVVAPGFVDAHTHMIFAGDRCHEFMMRLEGATYREIAAAGGGIQHTVRMTRAASEEALWNNSLSHLNRMIQHGTTTVEVKSGYGLNAEAERKMLNVARTLSQKTPIDIVTTFLGAHDFPTDRPKAEYIRVIKHEMLPVVAAERLAEFCDVFCDQGYYSADETRDICGAAQSLGLKIKLHVDELADGNGAALAAELGAVSADHLILANADGIHKMAAAGTIAVLLPGTSFALKSVRHAPAKEMIRAGVRVALATDFNPGTLNRRNASRSSRDRTRKASRLSGTWQTNGLFAL